MSDDVVVVQMVSISVSDDVVVVQMVSIRVSDDVVVVQMVSVWVSDVVVVVQMVVSTWVLVVFIEEKSPDNFNVFFNPSDIPMMYDVFDSAIDKTPFDTVAVKPALASWLAILPIVELVLRVIIVWVALF